MHSEKILLVDYRVKNEEVDLLVIAVVMRDDVGWIKGLWNI